jgi:hypothetical protein
VANFPFYNKKDKKKRMPATPIMRCRPLRRPPAAPAAYRAIHLTAVVPPAHLRHLKGFAA